ncbi:PREDICTED: cytochrome P450 71D10 [Theobroma cacao]|uniref:Cytochrome P450 71D10 n=1 Tax=Theobroma cacao TaxID=3641 RepID=A0AB32UWL3_THECC|nr:PREDICTED: cytochrome P450 71D10 [Theobroma cacao]
MELESSSSNLFLITFFLFFTVVQHLKAQKAKKSFTRLPPGPWKLPLIGNLHQLVSTLPHHTLRDLAKKYGPLMWLKLGEVPTLVVSSPEMAKEVMRTHDVTFCQRPYLLAASIMGYNFQDIIFSPYGNYWRQMKKICMTELLSTNRVQSFQSIREQEVSALMEIISSNARSPVNLSEKIYSLTYGITARAAFGKKSGDEEEFIRIAIEVSKLAGGFCLADMYPSNEMLKLISGIRLKLEKLHKASDRILEKIIDQHKERRNGMANTKTGNKKDEEDLVDILLKLQQQGDLDFPLSKDNIKAVIQDIFGAGSEASSNTVEWAMSEMVRNPKLMKEAQAEVRRVFHGKGKVDEVGLEELKFLKLIVKETLRLYPAGPLLIPRECSEDCVIGGYEIPAKTKVIVNAWAIGRDPSYWKEAEKFQPERFIDKPIDFRGTNFEYIPFGAGRRMCPGISFALPNIELPLANLLYHFDWKLPNKMKCEDLDMTESFGLTIRRKNDLFLIPIPYRSLLKMKVRMRSASYGVKGFKCFGKVKAHPLHVLSF